MNELDALAQDFREAARRAPHVADEAVHAVAHDIELRAGLGHAQSVVATFPDEGQASLGGIDSSGLYQEGQGSPALADVDIHQVGADLADRIANDSVRIITRGLA